MDLSYGRSTRFCNIGERFRLPGGYDQGGAGVGQDGDERASEQSGAAELQHDFALQREGAELRHRASERR